MARFGWRCGWCGLAVAAVGCSSSPYDLAEVRGRVQLDGKPVPAARVEFTPTDGSPSYGTTGPDGGYELRFTRSVVGAQTGRHLVRVTTARPEQTPDGKPTPEAVPAKFNAESKLFVDVAPGPNTIDLDLKSR